jgi:hypothetical protein
MSAKLRSAGYDNFITTQSGTPAQAVQSPSIVTIKVGSKVKVKTGAKTYEGKTLASFVYDNVYDVQQLSGARAVIGQRGVVTAAMKVVDLIPQ